MSNFVCQIGDFDDLTNSESLSDSLKRDTGLEDRCSANLKFKSSLNRRALQKRKRSTNPFDVSSLRQKIYIPDANHRQSLSFAANLALTQLYIHNGRQSYVEFFVRNFSLSQVSRSPKEPHL